MGPTPIPGWAQRGMFVKNIICANHSWGIQRELVAHLCRLLYLLRQGPTATPSGVESEPQRRPATRDVRGSHAFGPLFRLFVNSFLPAMVWSLEINALANFAGRVLIWLVLTPLRHCMAHARFSAHARFFVYFARFSGGGSGLAQNDLYKIAPVRRLEKGEQRTNHKTANNRTK